LGKKIVFFREFRLLFACLAAWLPVACRPIACVLVARLLVACFPVACLSVASLPIALPLTFILLDFFNE
jgi:hypothetical protein